MAEHLQDRIQVERPGPAEPLQGLLVPGVNLVLGNRRASDKVEALGDPAGPGKQDLGACSEAGLSPLPIQISTCLGSEEALSLK